MVAFATPEEAEIHAARLRGILRESTEWFADPANREARAALLDPDRFAPLTPNETKVVLAGGTVPRDRGFGWGGIVDELDEAVRTVGSFLLVTGLEADPTQSQPDPHPLLDLFGTQGGTPLLEGDRAGQGSIAADVSCRVPDEATGLRLRDEIGDAALTARYYARPPWTDPPTEAEALARATVRRWQDAGVRAIQDPEFHRIVERMDDSLDDPEEFSRISHELTAWIAARSATLVEGPVDATVLALLATEQHDPLSDDYRTWILAIGEPIGQLPLHATEQGYRFPTPASYATSIVGGTARLDGDRLELGWLSFGRFSSGGLQMLAYLGDAGCTDVRYSIVDYDALGVD